MGRSIFQYLRALRMERAAELLGEGKMSVTQVALEVGYTSPSHFSTTFHETFSKRPTRNSNDPKARRLTFR